MWLQFTEYRNKKDTEKVVVCLRSIIALMRTKGRVLKLIKYLKKRELLALVEDFTINKTFIGCVGFTKQFYFY